MSHASLTRVGKGCLTFMTFLASSELLRVGYEHKSLSGQTVDPTHCQADGYKKKRRNEKTFCELGLWVQRFFLF